MPTSRFDKVCIWRDADASPQAPWFWSTCQEDGSSPTLEEAISLAADSLVCPTHQLPMTFGKDPYSVEIHQDLRPKWSCDQCRILSELDI